MKRLLPILLLLAAVFDRSGLAQRPIELTRGMVIDRSTTIRRDIYPLAASADLQTPAVIIRGANITVDFNEAVLTGGPADADPDSFAGVGILIDGPNITLKNAVVRGYKVAVLARRSPDLHLSHNELSYNWKQRLYSGIEKESLVDWMSYHQNEKDEWLRYGAAIYLSECDRAALDNNTAIQGQNGLMVTRSAGLKIWNNTFQFLSAIGVGFYRVTDSRIMHNRIDWCVRGYSHGFYNRGQDSAGLLMYEQSSRNTIAYNSITHGGDGLFLWAGQSTMDTGQGGSNDNLFYGNDFSHAATNGIEATFSTNTFVENVIEECWHGVWGGYSYRSIWLRNVFARNVEAIAIEHGQDNHIQDNIFDSDETGIRLWQNASQDASWGYPKRRDTRSRTYEIARNTFRGTTTAIDIRATSDVRFGGNTFANVQRTFAEDADRIPLDGAPAVLRSSDYRPVPSLPDATDPMIKHGERRGRDTIIVDGWGPYDWKSPKLWPAGKPDDQPLTLRVLGPEGDWDVLNVRGAAVAPQRGRVPGAIRVSPTSRSPVDVTLTLEYRGQAVTSPRGTRTHAGAPYRFEYSRFFVPIDWRVRFFEYAEATDPVKQSQAFEKLVSGAPLKTITTDRLDYVSGRAFEDGAPRDRFALVAEGTAGLPAGDYVLRVISDDGVRVWVDDALELDSWEPHESKVDSVPLKGGSRRFKVHYFEVGGFAELRFDIQRR